MAAAALDLASVFGETARLRVAEAVDGLIDVAHRIEPIGRTHQIDEFCLLRIRVLELIHQHMVELGAQTSLRFGMRFEQAHGVFFEIGEIERAGLAFALAVDAVEAMENLEE